MGHSHRDSKELGVLGTVAHLRQDGRELESESDRQSVKSWIGSSHTQSRRCSTPESQFLTNNRQEILTIANHVGIKTL